MERTRDELEIPRGSQRSHPFLVLTASFLVRIMGAGWKQNTHGREKVGGREEEVLA